jgi:DNA repair ATPase RecN
LRKITHEEKRDVFRRWLNGDSYRQILEDLDIGLASIYRIIDEVRKQSLDIDQLRKLHVRLKKSGFTIYDALRACHLLEHLNNYGISVGELQQYINLSQRTLSDKKLQDKVMTYAIRLMQLEQKYGKPYEEVTKDFNRLVEETEGRKAENAELKQQNTELKKKAENKAETNRQLDEERVEISNELAQVTTTYEQLQDFGPEKLQKLAKFAQDTEVLGFSIEEVQKLSTLRKELTRLGFDPDNLEKDLLRIRSLSGRATELESKVESLDNTKNQLLKTDTALLAAHTMLQTNTIGIPCKNCRRIMGMPLPTKQEYSDITSRGGFIPITCPHCGSYQTLSMPEIMVHVAWALLR